MLGRNAANLYWMSRYIERMENVARLLDVGYRMSLTAGAVATNDHLHSMLRAAAVDRAFNERHEDAGLSNVAHFMLFDRDNPGSVYNCLAGARTNARAVRTAITQDMWSSLNDAWIAYARTHPNSVTPNRLPAFLQQVKQAAHQFRGAFLSTHLRNDGYYFAQLGNFIERADNTARILDVKYYVLLPRADAVGGDVDLHQWTMILRAASAHRAYRHVYQDRYRAFNIAEFLILKPEMPRSLAFCHNWIRSTLNDLEAFYGRRAPCHDRAEALTTMLFSRSMKEIFRDGLHEYLSASIAENDALSAMIGESYNFN